MAGGDDDRVPVGYVRRAHGLNGAVLVRALTDAPAERYAPGAALDTDEAPGRTLTVAESRAHRDGILVRFAEVRNRDEAEALRGITLSIARWQRRPLEADEYWEDDLVGLAVHGVDGTPLGTVTGVVMAAAQDRLVVTSGDGDEVEVPFVAPIVVAVEAGRVVLDPPDGLF